jgi:hypothetical protein
MRSFWLIGNLSMKLLTPKLKHPAHTGLSNNIKLVCSQKLIHPQFSFIEVVKV